MDTEDSLRTSVTVSHVWLAIWQTIGYITESNLRSGKCQMRNENADFCRLSEGVSSDTPMVRKMEVNSRDPCLMKACSWNVPAT